MFADKSFRILLCHLISTALPRSVPETSLETGRGLLWYSTCVCSFLWLFVAKCFKSTLVVVLILPYIILHRNICFLVLGFWFCFIFLVGFRGGLNFASEN